MAIFSKLYYKMIHWAKHPKGHYFLGGISFIESSIFPLPPDIMLAPMVRARPNWAWRLASITTIFSVLGAILGYGIGFFAFDTFGKTFIETMGYQSTYAWVEGAFDRWGMVIVFVSAFTPIPFKIFTIASGVAHMQLLVFLMWAILGRGSRFFLEAKLVKVFGATFEKKVLIWLDKSGWLLLGLLLVGWLVFRNFLT